MNLCAHPANAVRHCTPLDHWRCRFCESIVCVRCYVAHNEANGHYREPVPLTCACCDDMRNVRRP